MNQSQYIGSFHVTDGYNGHIATIHAVFTGLKIVHVTTTGFHVSPALRMDISDIAEAKWLIENHPSGRQYYS